MAIERVRLARSITLAAVAVAALLASAPRAVAEDKVSGTITVRSETTFTLMQADGSSVIVALDESTKVESGRSAADLMPGLRCEVTGTFDAERQLVARKVTFSKESYRIANAINAGLTWTNAQVASNKTNIEQGATVLRQHGATIDSQGQTLAENRQRIATNEAKAVATSGAFTTRMNELDQYNVVDKLVVYFKNGDTAIPGKYATQLQDFAGKAQAVNGYKVQVQGYASAVGSRGLNESLSAKRAAAVTSVLAQKGGIPPANLLVPAAMGTSEQVAQNNTAKGQAENRRVVVTILQSRGLVDR